MFPVGFAGRTSILTGVFTAFFNYNEAGNSDNAIDSIGGINLTPSGSIVRAAAFGSIPFCKTFNSSTPNYYVRAGSSVFNNGDINYSWCGWFYQDTADFTSTPRIFGKGTATNEYVLSGSRSGGFDILTWTIVGSGTMAITASNNLSLGQRWVWYYCDHNATNNTFRLYLRDTLGATLYDSGNAATTITPTVGTEDFIIGIAGNFINSAFKGFQCSQGYTRNAVLTTAQMNAHYNLGAGVTYPF